MSASELELIKDDVKVQFIDLGEGISGEYNEQDPEDVSLLRFDVLQKDRETGEFEQVDSASYCTQIPAQTDAAMLQVLLGVIMDSVYESLRQDASIKKICERLSWLDQGSTALDYPRAG